MDIICTYDFIWRELQWHRKCELTSRVWWCGICRVPIGRPLLIRGGSGLLLVRHPPPLLVLARAPETPSEEKHGSVKIKEQFCNLDWQRYKNPFQPELRCWETYWKLITNVRLWLKRLSLCIYFSFLHFSTLTCAATVLVCELMLALVSASGSPHIWQRRLMKAWSGIRTPTSWGGHRYYIDISSINHLFQ